MSIELTTDVQVQQWYEVLIEDLKDIAVETEFTSRWALVEGRHQMGKRIVQEYENFQKLRMPDSELVQRIALSIQRHKRTVYYAIQFARQFPDLKDLPEGKNLSWSHIINKYLATGNDKPKPLTRVALISIIREIKKLLETEYLKAHQEEVGMLQSDYNYDKVKALVVFIRYLQDQVDKLTGELE